MSSDELPRGRSPRPRSSCSRERPPQLQAGTAGSAVLAWTGARAAGRSHQAPTALETLTGLQSFQALEALKHAKRAKR
eukprot:11703450-Alexandrium_andersonii.AAC.1